MAFTQLSDDLNIIQALDDEPNDVGGLSATELKAKFDQAANIIKTYLNDTLLSELGGETGAPNIGVYPIDDLPEVEDVQAALLGILEIAKEAQSGTLTPGIIDTVKLADSAVTTDKIADSAVTTAKIANSNVTTGKIADSAVTAAKIAANAVETAKIKDSAVATAKIATKAVTVDKIADLAVASNKLAADSVTTPKIVDGSVTTAKIFEGAVTAAKIASGAVSTTYTATIGTTWTGSAAPYTQSVSVSGLLATDTPIVDIVPSDTFATAEAQLEAYGNIYRMVAGANTLTVYATEKTTVAIPIQIKAVRK